MTFLMVHTRKTPNPKGLSSMIVERKQKKKHMSMAHPFSKLLKNGEQSPNTHDAHVLGNDHSSDHALNL